MIAPDAIEALAAVLDNDGHDPVTCDRFVLVAALSELYDLRSMLREALDEARGARHMLAEWVAEDGKEGGANPVDGMEGA